MEAGDLRSRVVIERRVSGQDEFGQHFDVWRPLVKLWAEIDTLSVREVIAAQGLNAGATHKITVRWIPLFENTAEVAALRVRFNRRLFNLKGAANVGQRNQEVWMLATEGLNEG